MRKTVQITAVTLLHLVLSTVFLFAAFGSVMGRFDTGQSPTWGMRITETLGQVLLYPVFIPLGGLVTVSSGPASHLLMLLNSLVWGLAIVGLGTLVRRRFSSPPPWPIESGA